MRIFLRYFLLTLVAILFAIPIGFAWVIPASGQAQSTPIVAVTATPILAVTATEVAPSPSAPTTFTKEPTVTLAPTVEMSPTEELSPTQALTTTVVPERTPSPAPTMTPRETKQPTQPPPVVAPWATPTEQPLLPAVLGDSPAIRIALMVVAGMAAIVIILLIVVQIQQRSLAKKDPEEVEAARAVVEESLVLDGGLTLAGRYRVIDSIGKGNLGEVFLAWDSVLRRNVAIKVLRQQVLYKARTEGISEGEKLLHEARATSKLQHPNIVIIHDMGEGGHRIPLYIVMEYIEGTPLSKYLEGPERRGRPLNARMILAVSYGVLAALEHAHEQDVIHRDLKPANIIVSGAGESLEVKLMDFGLAFKARKGELHTIPEDYREGNLVGTPNYIAPEIVRRATPTQAADLYSFGVLLFQMVTGFLPYPARTAKEAFLEHLHGVIPDPREFRRDLCSGMAELIMQLMHKNPGKRPVSAAEVIETLKSLEGQFIGYDETGPAS